MFLYKSQLQMDETLYYKAWVSSTAKGKHVFNSHRHKLCRKNSYGNRGNHYENKQMKLHESNSFYTMKKPPTERGGSLQNGKNIYLHIKQKINT